MKRILNWLVRKGYLHQNPWTKGWFFGKANYSEAALTGTDSEIFALACKLVDTASADRKLFWLPVLSQLCAAVRKQDEWIASNSGMVSKQLVLDWLTGYAGPQEPEFFGQFLEKLEWRIKNEPAPPVKEYVGDHICQQGDHFYMDGKCTACGQSLLIALNSAYTQADLDRIFNIPKGS